MEQKQYKSRELLKRFIPYLLKYKNILGKDLICASLTTICELVLPLIMRYITNEGLRDLAALSVKTIAGLGVLYLVLRAIDCLAGFYMAHAGHVMGARIETDMRRDAYGHLLRLSDTYYSNTKIGQIMGRITSDLPDVTEFSHHFPEELFIVGIKISVSFVILTGINAWLTILIFLCIPLMIFVCLKLNFRMRGAFRKLRSRVGDLNARLEDSLLGHKVVKAFTNEAAECEKFDKENCGLLDIKSITFRYMAEFQTSVKMFDGLMYLIVVVAGGIFMIKGLIAPGDLVAYMMYISTLIATVRRIIEYAEQFQRGMTGIERFFQLMDTDIEIFDEPDAVALENPKGNITFENVSFEYPDDHNKVFSGLNLQIHAGEKLAIVGPSGGGKTTLCNLIPRFYDVTNGKITLDGQDIKHYTLKSLRGSIGIVQQDVYLFSGTVFDNISYGRPGATMEEVVEAAKRAGAHEFIEELQDGYNTYVGERGVKLSGGQKQRISIARVFLKNPPIIILDEATSALDNESEFAVAQSLGRLSEGRTTLTIAHRLSSIKNSDRILVLTDEGIVEEGNHDQLMAQKGMYYHFYEMANSLK